MDKEPKFDLGLEFFKDKRHRKTDKEYPTALRHIGVPSRNPLFEARGSIWRSKNLSEVQKGMPIEVVVTFTGRDDVETLQNISKFADEEFGKLKKHGIRFYGEFIVHDVNGEPALVTAVPKVEERVVTPKNPLSTEEWQAMAAANAERYENLLKYFDECVANKKPILWDIIRADQFVYGKDPVRSDMAFILVDTDLYYGDDHYYVNFLGIGEDALDGTIKRQGARFTPELQARYEKVRDMYQTRRKKQMF
jgi:hypothetical protein